MGSAASKQRVYNQTKTAARAPLVKVNRQPNLQPNRDPNLQFESLNRQSLRPDGHDPQVVEGESSPLLDHLRRIKPVDLKEQHESYRPASSDYMSRTLEARQHHETVDPLTAKKSENKTLLPGQTITAVVRMMQRGEPREQIVQTFQLDPHILDKLEILTIPTAPGPQGGVGIRRSR